MDVRLMTRWTVVFLVLVTTLSLNIKIANNGLGFSILINHSDQSARSAISGNCITVSFGNAAIKIMP